MATFPDRSSVSRITEASTTGKKNTGESEDCEVGTIFERKGDSTMGSRKVRFGVKVDLAPPGRKRPKPKTWRGIPVDSKQDSFQSQGRGSFADAVKRFGARILDPFRRG
jgi:hypothetical protein